MEKYNTWIGKKVKAIIDRPMGSIHPDYPKLKYPINYGYLPNTKSIIDNEEIDVYVLGPTTPLQKFNGIVIAVIIRVEDEIKLIITDGQQFSKNEIENKIKFQEKYFVHKIIQ